MKKICLLLLVFGTYLLNAQGRRENQSAIHAEYGFLPSKNDTKTGSSFVLGYSRVFGNKGFLGKADFFYQNYEVAYRESQIFPYQKYGVNINAGYSYEGFYPLMLNAWLGGFVGYESVNQGNTTASETNENLEEKLKGFVYGISGSLEGEFYLTRQFSLLANYKQFYDFKSQFSQSNYGIFVGLKYYLN